MEEVKKIIEKKKLNNYSVNSSNTVNSNKKYLNTVNSYSSFKEKANTLIRELNGCPEWLAQKLAEDLDDKKSFDYYLILARGNSAERLLEALSYTLDASNRGKIKTKKAIYFQGILRRWKIKTKFTA